MTSRHCGWLLYVSTVQEYTGELYQDREKYLYLFFSTITFVGVLWSLAISVFFKSICYLHMYCQSCWRTHLTFDSLLNISVFWCSWQSATQSLFCHFWGCSVDLIIDIQVIDTPPVEFGEAALYCFQFWTKYSLWSWDSSGTFTLRAMFVCCSTGYGCFDSQHWYLHPTETPHSQKSMVISGCYLMISETLNALLLLIISKYFVIQHYEKFHINLILLAQSMLSKSCTCITTRYKNHKNEKHQKQKTITRALGQYLKWSI